MADDDGWTMIGKAPLAATPSKKKTKPRKLSESGTTPPDQSPPARTRHSRTSESDGGGGNGAGSNGASGGGGNVAPAAAPAAVSVAPLSTPSSQRAVAMEAAPLADTPPVEFRIDSADGCAYCLDEFRTCYGGTTSSPPVEWTTSVIAGYGWPCRTCGVLNAPADLGCRECHVERVEPPPPLEKRQGKLEAVLMIPQKSIGSLIGKAGAKIRIIRDTSRCYVHVSEERGERRVVTLTGTAKEIAICKELMRVAIDAVDDSMGETIKSEIARRKAALAATGGGRRGDPTLVVPGSPRQPLATDGNGGRAPHTPRGGYPHDDRLYAAAPEHPPHAHPHSLGHPPQLAAAHGATPPPAALGAPSFGAPAPAPSANTYPQDPAAGRGMFMSASLDAFYRRAAATCSTEAERAAMAAEVQIAVVRRGMALLGRDMTTEQVRVMLQSSIEETPVSFQELCDVVKQVAWESEPVPLLPTLGSPSGSASGSTATYSPRLTPPALAMAADTPLGHPAGSARSPRSSGGPGTASLCRACRGPGADKTCTGCNAVKYCCVGCQREDWRSGGHKEECAMLWRTGGEDHLVDTAATAGTGSTAPSLGSGEPRTVRSGSGSLGRLPAPTARRSGGNSAPAGTGGDTAAAGGSNGDSQHHGALGFEITFLQGTSDFLLGDEMANGVVDAAVGGIATTTATSAAESVLSSPDPPGGSAAAQQQPPSQQPQQHQTPWPDMHSLPTHFGANGHTSTHQQEPPLTRVAGFSVMRLPEPPQQLPSLANSDLSPHELATWAGQVAAVLDQSFALAVTLWPSTLDQVDREIESAESMHRAQLEGTFSHGRDAALAALPTLRQLRQRVDDARRQWSPKWNEELARFEAELRGMQMEVAKLEADARAETATVAGLRGGLATANAQAAEFEQRMRDECEVVAAYASSQDYEHRLNSLVGMQTILADAVAASKAAVDHQRNLRAATARAGAKAKQSALLSDEMSIAAARLNDLFGADIVKIARPAAAYREVDAGPSAVQPDFAAGWGQVPSKLQDGRGESDDTSDEGAVSDEHDPHSYPLVPASHTRSRFFNGSQPVGTPTKSHGSRSSNGRRNGSLQE